MNQTIKQLHSRIQYFEAIGAWGLAQVFKEILAKYLTNSGTRGC